VNKANGEAATNLRLIEKEKARLEKAALEAKRFYDLAKGVRNQLLASTSKGEKDDTISLLNKAFAAMGLEIPADVPPML
jgi:hypothetical protein